MVIDIHNHFIPNALFDYVREHGDSLHAQIIDLNGKEYIRHEAGFQHPILKEYFDYQAKTEDMDRMGIDKAVLSLSPSVFFYYADIEFTITTSQLCNNWLADFISKYGQRFDGMATLPMQDEKEALRELIRAHETLGFNAIEIAPVIINKQLDEEVFFPIYEYCANQQILIFLHPYFPGYPKKPEYARYYNSNLMGNVNETNIGINHMIFGGVFEQFPSLKVLTAHGGGYFPYQAGRIVHGYEVRKEPKIRISKSPESYFGNVFFDTITHWTASLQFLSDNFGAGQIMLGTDYPYDMGDENPVETVGKLRITEKERQKVLYGNAGDFFFTKQ
jgi:aminocarboxymuconate-semialdehyde decarboxylase